MGENGTALELEDLSPGRIVGKHVGSRDIGGHEIRRKLYARETKTQNLTEATHHERLAQSRHPLQQAVTAADKRDKDLFDESSWPTIVRAISAFNHRKNDGRVAFALRFLPPLPSSEFSFRVDPKNHSFTLSRFPGRESSS